MPATNDIPSTSFADRVVEEALGANRILMLPTPAEDVVSWRGSFLVYPDFAAGDELLQELAVSLLDKGTQQRDRFELARVLEDCGAQLHLSSDGLRVEFSARALRRDVPKVLDVLAEMLRYPAFDAGEFEKARAQVAAQLQREMEETGAQAGSALTRAIYDEAHPNHSPDPRDLLMQLQGIDLERVKDFHALHFGPTEFTIALVGDLDPKETFEQVSKSFADWPEAIVQPTHSTESRPPVAGESSVVLPDRSNLDVYMGHGLSLRRDDDDYLPLYVGNFILGGNFSARLMASVRDEKGLTYGIGSSVAGVTIDYDGHWYTNVTLSQEKLDEGIAATREVIADFVECGATDEELADKKTTITGSFKVNIASTRQLARTLLSNAERDFPMSYLDDFPTLVNELDIDQVNAAVRKHIHPAEMHTAVAGEVPAAATTSAA